MSCHITMTHNILWDVVFLSLKIVQNVFASLFIYKKIKNRRLSFTEWAETENYFVVIQSYD